MNSLLKMLRKEPSKTRLITALALAVGVTVFSAGIVWAAHPHFVGKVTATLLEDGDVKVCFKEAGLGNNTSITYIATADSSATYVCVNHGGQCPNAENKITVAGPVATPGTFTSGANGQISQCLIISPPSPGDFSCPPGQTLTFADVSYTNIAITDTTTPVGPVNAHPSSFGKVIFFTCPGP